MFLARCLFKHYDTSIIFEMLCILVLPCGFTVIVSSGSQPILQTEKLCTLLSDFFFH